jgi:hypothetical protein
MTLSAPTALTVGLNWFVACLGGGTQYVTLDASTNGGALFGPQQRDYSTAWGKARIYGMPGFVRVLGIEVTPGVYGWMFWSGTSRMADDATPSHDWSWSGPPKLLTGAGSPDGVLSAAAGRMYRDSVSGVKYMNVDGATAWEVV